MKLLFLDSFYNKSEIYTEDVLILINTNWDDNFSYKVEFTLNLQRANSKEITFIGNLKIGKKNQQNTYLDIDKEVFLDYIGEPFFSLGQSEDYYNNLKTYLSKSEQAWFYKAVNDIAYDLELFDNVKAENVTRKSLLRFVFENTVREQFNRIANGGDKFTGYEISFFPKGYNFENKKLEFNVDPNSVLRSNIHVLIGRNGVGKSFLMNSMVENLLYGKVDNGNFLSDINITSLVVSSFSAFDKYFPIKVVSPQANNIEYKYIGLKKNIINKENGKEEQANKDTDELIVEFSKLAYDLVNNVKKDLWLECIESLESDHVFKNVNIGRLVDFVGTRDEFMLESGKAFDRLSSGHKIIILTISSLVEMVSEKSLVILDEPEGHLHPPLLAAFMRTLSNLLNKKNGVALISTHSPVVLQEVPSSCVWTISRIQDRQTYKRLGVKPFAENVGVLTREVFGLEVVESGYHNVLKNLASEYNSYDEALDSINSDLGNEGKGILMSLILNK